MKRQTESGVTEQLKRLETVHTKLDAAVRVFFDAGWDCAIRAVAVASADLQREQRRLYHELKRVLVKPNSMGKPAEQGGESDE